MHFVLRGSDKKYILCFVQTNLAFYRCPFSAEAAPHFNAMGRIYTDLPIFAVDSSRSQFINFLACILSSAPFST